MECPPEDVLASLVARELDASSHASVTAHVDACELCREVLVAAVRAGAHAEAVTMPARRPSGDALVADEIGVGDRVGRYELRRLLGAGGMGRVFEAFDPQLDRAVALKLMRAELVGRGDFAERLLRESRMMAKLAHAAVITVYDVGRDHDIVFIAMELVRGETLGAYVHRVKPGWRAVAGWLARAGEGLAAAHAAGIVHRDFKPDNVLVEIVDDVVVRVVVTDFGVARTLATDEQASAARPADSLALTAVGAIVGTPAYMPPEQLAGESVDARADVFSYAVTAWELLFGERPFRGDTAAELRSAIARAPRGPASTSVPRQVTRRLERALSAAPDARGELRDVREALARAARPSRRAAWAAGAIVGLLALLGSGALAMRSPAAPRSPCDRTADAVAAQLQAQQAPLIAALGAQPAALRAVSRAATSWFSTHAETCPAAAPAVAACLAARAQELLGTMRELVGDAHDSAALVALVGDPRACAASGGPSPGLLFATLPAEPALQHQVTALRRTLFAAEAAMARGDTQAVRTVTDRVGPEAATLWPPLEAEVRYLRALAEARGGSTADAQRRLRETAALAERVHADAIVANAWLQLAYGSTYDEGDRQRGFEYLTYAAAAIARLGQPPTLLLALEYARGTALVEAGRGNEGEASLRHAVELAKQHDPSLMPQVLQGLGFYYEEERRYAEAVALYREAMASLDRAPHAPSLEIVMRERLATSLVFAGEVAAGVREARAALALAEATLPVENLDRLTASLALGQLLEEAGQLAEALTHVRAARARFTALLGAGSPRVAEATIAEANVLTLLGKSREAATLYLAACAAVEDPDDALLAANCWSDAADALIATDNTGPLIAGLEAGLRQALASDGPDAVEPALRSFQLARLRIVRPPRSAASLATSIAEMERALGVLVAHRIEPGDLGNLQLELGELVWPRDHARGHALVTAAVASLRTATPRWSDRAARATAFLATHEAR